MENNKDLKILKKFWTIDWDKKRYLKNFKYFKQLFS